MAAKFRIVYTDGRTVEAGSTPRGEIATEKQYNVPVTELTSAEQIYYLLWASVTKVGKDGPTFDDWVDTVESADPVKADVDVNPTQPVPQPAG